MIEGLAEAIDGLAGADPRVLADSESVLALYRELARLEAVVARATAVWDVEQRWADDGGRTGASWLSIRARVPKESARRRIRLGRALRGLPCAERAWLAGEIDGAHVSLLAAQRTPVTETAMVRDEVMLVGEAGRLDYRSFVRALAYWRQRNDPDGVEVDAKRLHDERRLSWSQTFQGVWVGDVVLDPIGGAIVDNALRALEQDLFDADWAEVRARLGTAATVADLARTPGQRRADALVEMASRAMTAPAAGRRPAPLFTVLVGYETFAGRICELADRTVVSPGSLLGWLDQAYVERVVFDGPSRVLDVGVTRRLFSGATRRAVEVRDQQCFHPLCDQPAERCEIDHEHAYTLGGPTSQANGRPACGHHNRSRNNPPEQPQGP